MTARINRRGKIKRHKRMPLASSQPLSHYRLVEQIGEGGMDVVWKAEDTKLSFESADSGLNP